MLGWYVWCKERHVHLEGPLHATGVSTIVCNTITQSLRSIESVLNNSMFAEFSPFPSTSLTIIGVGCTAIDLGF